ncbi:tRNA (adenosine(37)-N6)-threonylcarbamoyltransferase complex ATPase subunit type 1 TsaE [Neobittarella massiliensis]|uniref:tRNA threonylcarbamoyladenosine biosynthesis protein TsaE n=2 Tax=Oscillospiraceae TaxID=216572 RepID=A0A8J6INP2_9FIRM|nr:tRNA (adenosine(37)-N6)-threonylcarbamoyltransferase complex ATPase subunit type 1 TsaE [Neobittarella massiliensis]MBC3515256.1 tRNA (adenosine(37)-N6)-threonylcarbamoyltransferase complex ATPase subunit type 1 TsaE [Neobittarella massiliensis]SCJ61314.1 ADP-binding protein [uncultured Anaerotruncus sp.]
MEFITESTQQTEALAKKLARRLRPGDVVAYRGGMGAGKTAFTRGLAAGLGATGEVSSPTFAIVNEYPGPLPLYHFDMYRILDLDDLETTGYYDYLDAGDSVLAIEWSENIQPALPEHTIYITIQPLSEDRRRIVVENLERGA